MAENVNITPGSGAAIAADQVADDPVTGIGTAYVQYVKVMDGTIGGTSKVVVQPTGALVVTIMPTGDNGLNISEALYLEQYEQNMNALSCSGVGPSGNNYGYELR